MNIALKPEFEQYVQEQISTGRFASPSDVLEASLSRMMLEIDEEDLVAIEQSDKDIAEGKTFPLAEVKAGFQARLRDKK